MVEVKRKISYEVEHTFLFDVERSGFGQSPVAINLMGPNEEYSI